MPTAPLPTRRKTLLQALPFLLAVLAAGPLPAAAGDVKATVTQNPSTLFTDSNPEALAHASLVTSGITVAEATTTRQSITATIDGTGVEQTELRGADGSARTDYVLWDVALDAPLDGSFAAGLLLAFDFHVLSEVTLPPVSLSSARLAFDAALFSAGFETTSNAISAVFGPGPGGLQYLIDGDATLLGAVDTSFTLFHRDRVNGLLTMGLAVGGANAGDATGTLSITGVRLMGGTLPVGGVAVRLETGEMLPVSAVPEAPALAMALAGLLVVATLARRRGLVQPLSA